MSVSLNKNVSGIQAPSRIGFRLTIARLFSLLLAFLCLYFIIAGSVLYFRLENIDDKLQKFEQQNVPQVFNSSQLFSKANLLLYSVQELSSANSSAAQRIVTQNIERRLDEIVELQTDVFDQFYVFDDLTIIAQEIARLDTLINDKLILLTNLDQDRERLLSLLDNDLVKLANDAEPSEQLFRWSLLYTQAIFSATEALAVEKLTTLRTVQARFRKQTNDLLMLGSQMNSDMSARTQPLTSALVELLDTDSGLFATRADFLKVRGRARGQGNFLINLIQDYTRLTEDVAYGHKTNAITELQQLKQQVTSQSLLLLGMQALTFFALLFAVFVIHNRVVKRLRSLNNFIKRQFDQQHPWKADQSKDEIGELSRTMLAFSETIAAQKHALHQLSMTDELTGIANRRHFDYQLKLDIANAMAESSPLSVVLIDVDFFKPFNDNYGHSEGDAALKDVANIIHQTVQNEQTLVARYGGEEFVCILPNTGSQQAIELANELHNAIFAKAIPHAYSPVSSRLTYSIGVTTWQGKDHCTAKQLLEEADQALYRAKSEGRNRSIHADPSSLTATK